MKIFGKVIYGFFILLVGLQLFSCSRNNAYNKTIDRVGNEAYDAKNFGLVNELFEYYKEVPVLEKTIELAGADNRETVTNKDISFDVYVYLQSEFKTNAFGKQVAVNNYFTVVVVDLDIENQNSQLDIIIKKDNKKEVIEQILYKRDKNWYIQQFLFDKDIDQIIISHVGASKLEPIILYDSLDDKPVFITENEHNIEQVLTDGLNISDYGIAKRSEDPLKKASWTVWGTMLVYVLAVGYITYAMYFKKPKQSQAQANYQVKQTEAEVKEVKEQNVNVKKIQEIEYRDDVSHKEETDE